VTIWPVIRLADHCDVITKGTTPTTVGYDFSDSGIPFIRVQNVGDLDVSVDRDVLFVDEDTHRALNRSHIRPGDVLVSIAGTIGRVSIVPDGAPPMNCNQAVAIVRTTPDFHKPYLRHWLQSHGAQDQMRGSAVTGTISNLSLEQLGRLKVPLPPIAEQRRIAEILDKAHALRAKRRAALAQVDSLSQSVFLEMFGDPSSNQSDWPLVRVGDVADVQGGLQVSAARKNYLREVSYLRVANVFRGYLDLKDIKLIRASDGEIARTSLLKDDLLIVEGHGNPAEIGRAALWDGSIPGCVHQNHLIRARFDAESIIPVYACTYLNSPFGRRHLLGAGKTTSGLNTINVSEVRATPIPKPPVQLQLKFAERIRAIGRLKANCYAARLEIDRFFASLQHRAFRGEL